MVLSHASRGCCFSFQMMASTRQRAREKIPNHGTKVLTYWLEVPTDGSKGRMRVGLNIREALVGTILRGTQEGKYLERFGISGTLWQSLLPKFTS